MRRQSTREAGCVISVLAASVIAITPALSTSSLVGAKLWREAVYAGGDSPVKGGKISQRTRQISLFHCSCFIIDVIMMVAWRKNSEYFF
jgi:hypothetical protein